MEEVFADDPPETRGADGRWSWWLRGTCFQYWPSSGTVRYGHRTWKNMRPKQVRQLLKLERRRAESRLIVAPAGLRLSL